MHREFVPLPPLFCTQSRSNRISCTVMLFGAPAGPVIVLVPTESEMRSWSAPSFSGSSGSKKLNVLQVSPAGQDASNDVPQPWLVVVEQYPFCRRSNCPLHTNAWACVGNPAAAIARNAASPLVIAHLAARLWECIICLPCPNCISQDPTSQIAEARVPSTGISPPDSPVDARVRFFMQPSPTHRFVDRPRESESSLSGASDARLVESRAEAPRQLAQHLVGHVSRIRRSRWSAGIRRSSEARPHTPASHPLVDRHHFMLARSLVARSLPDRAPLVVGARDCYCSRARVVNTPLLGFLTVALPSSRKTRTPRFGGLHLRTKVTRHSGCRDTGIALRKVGNRRERSRETSYGAGDPWAGGVSVRRSPGRADGVPWAIAVVCSAP